MSPLIYLFVFAFTASAVTPEEEIGFRSFSGFNPQNSVKDETKIQMDLLNKTFSGITWSNLEQLSEEVVDQLDHYEIPYNLSKKIVYFLAGDDYEGRPVWIAEVGKWNLVEIIKNGLEKEISLYFLQVGCRVLRSIKERSTEERPVTEAILILDSGELSMDQLRNIPTVSFFLRMLKDAREILLAYLGQILIVNANFVAQTGLGLVKPIFGGAFSGVAVFGTNKAAWMPKLLKMFPRETLPPWYGGDKNFKPVQIFG